jgi:adenine-specific DNA-methyltransferase
LSKYDHLSRSELIQALQRRDSERRFGLVWERERIDADASINDCFVLLETDEELSIGPGSRENLIVEGDNFDSLRYLRMTMKGKIKAIYIDPPYNRGLDLIYNDSFVAKDHAYRHSVWLEFMYQRLRTAHDLLRNDGVLFVSIDDKEYAQCKLLLDQVFGESNFMATLIWQTDGNFDNQAKFKISHEYILVYARDESIVPAPPVVYPYLEDDSKLHRPEIENSVVKNGPKNPVSEIILPAGFPATFEQGVVPARSDKWPHFDEDLVVENYALVKPVAVSSGWSSRSLLQAFIDQGCAPVLDRQDKPTRFVLTHTGAINYVKVRGDDHSYVPSVIRNVGSVEKTANYLAKEFGVDFDYPKPVGLLRYLFSMADDPEGIFLDFFAGSGTTGEAIMDLNRLDGGRRRFILASSMEATTENREKNICRDVTQKRIAGYIANHALETGVLYARTRLIPPDSVPEGIDHDGVWTALQQLHDCPVASRAAAATLSRAQSAGFLLCYLERTDSDVLGEVRQLLQAEAQPILLYSWRPAVIRDRFFEERLEVRKIPDSLLHLFRRQ